MKIKFTPLIAGKPWSGATIYEAPLGGSEKAVVYLAREFARNGHDVKVYTHGQPGIFEKVQYLPVQLLNGEQEPCDVHISSRWIDVIGLIPCQRPVLWLHDMPSAIRPIPCEHVVCISEFQRQAWNFSGDIETFVIGDGIDDSLYTGQEQRNNNRLIWISNPDRGLYVACKIFREQLLPRWPDLELHIYGRYAVYGWPLERERWYLPPPSWTGNGNILLKQPLPSLGLARELMKSWALFYPTFWPETFCMSALEAQAAGTPVITSPVGALPETVKGGIVTNDFVNAISQLRNKNRWSKLSTAGKEQAAAHTWGIIAAQWEKEVLCV